MKVVIDNNDYLDIRSNNKIIEDRFNNVDYIILLEKGGKITCLVFQKELKEEKDD